MRDFGTFAFPAFAVLIENAASVGSDWPYDNTKIGIGKRFLAPRGIFLPFHQNARALVFFFLQFT